MNDAELLDRMAKILQAYRDLERVALPEGCTEKFRKILDAYAEAL